LDSTAARQALDRALPQLDGVFAQVRSAEAPPKAMLSHLQSDVQAEDYDLGPDVRPATPTAPDWRRDDVGKEDRMTPRQPERHRRTPLEAALIGAALALILTAGVVGWIYMGTRADNRTLASELAALTKRVDALSTDVSQLHKKLDAAR
jgi:hypothetical protein